MHAGKEGEEGGEGEGGVEAEEKEEEQPALRAVEVQVQKRETERQLQQRINSYAYISQKEEEEAWKELKVRSVLAPASSSACSVRRVCGARPGACACACRVYLQCRTHAPT